MKTFLSILLLNLISMNNCFAKSYKINDLDKMAKILVENIDHDQKICHLSIKNSGLYLNVLHAKIDEATKAYADLIKHKEILSWDKTCTAECHCDFYQGILENNLSNEKIKIIYEKLKIAAEKITAEQKRACIEKSKSLCSSPLIKELIRDSKNFTPLN